MGAARGVAWPAMEEMWMMERDLSGCGSSGRLGGAGARAEDSCAASSVLSVLDGDCDRKCEMPSCVMRIGCVRLMSRSA